MPGKQLSQIKSGPVSRVSTCTLWKGCLIIHDGQALAVSFVKQGVEAVQTQAGDGSIQPCDLAVTNNLHLFV